MKIKNIFNRLNWILITQFGINFLLLFKGIRRTPTFLIDYFKFVSSNKVKYELQPCLHDKFESSGDFNTEYFVQDLLVAQLIFSNKPIKHIDLGSRIDGFVSNVASFRCLDVLDIRPMTNIIKNVNFLQLDIMKDNLIESEITDSLSCLHTLEHFGLGRYGDELNSNGYMMGLDNLIKILKNDGLFYLSTPVGKERILFNANYIFDIEKLVNYLQNKGLSIVEFYTISNSGYNLFNSITEELLFDLKNSPYNLVLFVLKKNI